jgi:hypothetical protein
VAVAACLTLMPVAWANEGDGGFAMFMAVSAVAAAWGAACTSVGDRFMRNYLKFNAEQRRPSGSKEACISAKRERLAKSG